MSDLSNILHSAGDFFAGLLNKLPPEDQAELTTAVNQVHAAADQIASTEVTAVVDKDVPILGLAISPAASSLVTGLIDGVFNDLSGAKTTATASATAATTASIIGSVFDGLLADLTSVKAAVAGASTNSPGNSAS